MAAAQAAALASADPVVRLRALLADKDAPTVVKELKGMTVEGGVAGEGGAGRERAGAGHRRTFEGHTSRQPAALGNA